MLEIEVIVERIIFRNEENGWCVLRTISEDTDLVATGTGLTIKEGLRYKLTGNMIFHNKYGEQFKFEHFEEILPDTKSGVIAYLSSGLIPYIGEKTAKSIYDKFGMETFKILEESPERLKEVEGIGSVKFAKMMEALQETKEAKSVIMFFGKLNMTSNLAMRVYQVFKDDSEKIVRENPYILADEVKGIGFKTADDIAMSLGFKKNDPFRIKSGIKYTLSQANLEGHTYLPREILVKKSAKVLEVGEEQVEKEINSLAFDKYFYIERIGDVDSCYFTNYYRAENFVAGVLTKLASKKYEINLEIEKEIEEVEDRKGIHLATNQKKAVEEALQNGVTVITGGPGTGKTTTLTTIIDLCEKEGLKVSLAAPTGRAAKRMEEATKRPASTLHKLLEIKPGVSIQEMEELECDVLIIDECSMVDLFLMHNILKAIPENIRLVLVGDKDQLPSVGAGNVLKDIIESEIIHVVYLNEIFRQEEGSLIIENAHRINKGIRPILDNKSKDFFFIESPDPRKTLKTIVDLVKDRLPAFKNLDSIRDIQVLSPMKKGIVGVDNLNKTLQEALNPKSGGEITSFGKVYRANDKVMQIKNNYNLEFSSESDIYHEEGMGVFNGELGMIEEIDSENREMWVVFDEIKRVEYPMENLSELTLAYASTIHKSQGSEFRAVIIPLHSAPIMLLSRNLLYTAITRASEMVVLVGDRKYLDIMVRNNHVMRRYTGLKDKIITTWEKRKIYGFI